MMKMFTGKDPYEVGAVERQNKIFPGRMPVVRINELPDSLGEFLEFRTKKELTPQLEIVFI